MKRIIIALLLATFLAPLTFAQEATPSQSEQDYVNKLYYRHNKLELVTKKRLIDEKRSYSDTDIYTTSFSYEAYTDVSTRISTQTYARGEVREVTEWYIYLGGISELSDFEFLKLIGDHQELARLTELEDQKARMRSFGNVGIGLGVLAMVGGAAVSASQGVITAGAVALTAGFFINSFNATPSHYLSATYALAKIDDYNLALKKKLNLPLSYE